MAQLLPSQRKIYQIGRTVFVDTARLKKLYGCVHSSSRATMRLHTGSAGYQVTSGKTLTIEAIRSQSSNTSTGQNTLAQSDNDVGFSAGTAFTNPVYFCGDSASETGTYPADSVSYQNYLELGAIGFNVAATKYCSFLNASGGVMWAWGYEN